MSRETFELASLPAADIPNNKKEDVSPPLEFLVEKKLHELQNKMNKLQNQLETSIFLRDSQEILKKSIVNHNFKNSVVRMGSVEGAQMKINEYTERLGVIRLEMGQVKKEMDKTNKLMVDQMDLFTQED